MRYIKSMYLIIYLGYVSLKFKLLKAKQGLEPTYE